MTQRETDAADVTLDLLAIQSSALEAIRDYSRYLRNAENAGLPEVAYFVHLLHGGGFGPRCALSGPVEKAGQHGERPTRTSACRAQAVTRRRAGCERSAVLPGHAGKPGAWARSTPRSG
jgi:hypothetical protein